MKKVFILFITVFFMFSCEDDQTRESEDCAGVTGGNNVCGCTDDQAMNFDSTATFDDDSCEYADNLDCAGVSDGNNICGCMDNSAVNYSSLATFDDGTCQYYNGSLSVVWTKTYGDIAGELWSIRPVSDGGFILSLGNAGDCVGTDCEYFGQLIRLDQNGDILWHKLYDESTGIYNARETSDGGFIAAGYYECTTSMNCYPDMFILKTDSEGNKEWAVIDGSGDNLSLIHI